MTDYIKREDAVRAIKESKVFALLSTRFFIEDLIKDIPAADVIEQKHGKWVDTEPHLEDWQQRKNGMAYYCSVCGHRAGKNKHRTYKYCPWCGAKMDGES